MSEPTKEALEIPADILRAAHLVSDWMLMHDVDELGPMTHRVYTACLREELRAAREALAPAIKQIEDMLKTPIDVRSTETLEQYHKRDPMPGRHGIFLTFDQMLALRAASKGGDAV